VAEERLARYQKHEPYRTTAPAAHKWESPGE
jgi:hypothetical protein